MKLIVGFYGTAFFAAGEYLKVVIDDNVGHYVEYIMSMNARIMNRPLVVEEERINFDK